MALHAKGVVPGIGAAIVALMIWGTLLAAVTADAVADAQMPPKILPVELLGNNSVEAAQREVVDFDVVAAQQQATRNFTITAQLIARNLSVNTGTRVVLCDGGPRRRRH